MKRLLRVAVVAAIGAAGATQADAQELINRRVSLFDLGIYAGGAWTSSWFEIDDEGYQVGLSPIFGAHATYWATPAIGVRLHGAYFPGNLPEADTDFDGNDNWVMNNWLYDLDLMFRPWITNTGMGNMLASTYFWVGGGGLTTNIAGGGDFTGAGFPCIGAYAPAGVCLSLDPEYASVGQGTVGVGFDFFPISSGMGIFGELGVHGYDSPAHVYSETRASDKFSFTTRANLGLKFMFGDLMPPPPPPPPPPPVAPPPPPPPPPAEQAIRVCVVEGTTLREVEAMYNPATGDTMVAGQAFATAFPATTPTYAAGATWYINNEPIQFMNRRYVKFGLPRVVGTTDLRHVGDFQGTPVFADATTTGTPDVVYIPVRPGCEFQPYQYEVPARGVRG